MDAGLEVFRRCKRCGEVKVLELFGVSKKPYRKHTCKACSSAYAQELRRQNPERYAEIHRRSRVKHAEKRRAYARQYGKDNPEQARAARRRYRDRHPDRHNASVAKWKKDNTEKVKQIKRRCQAQRRAAKQSAERAERVSAAEWKRIIGACHGRCLYCGSAAAELQVDHVIPLSRRGAHAVGNLVPACGACNRRKSALEPVEWVFREFGGNGLARLFLFVEGELHGKSFGD